MKQNNLIVIREANAGINNQLIDQSITLFQQAATNLGALIAPINNLEQS